MGKTSNGIIAFLIVVIAFLVFLLYNPIEKETVPEEFEAIGAINSTTCGIEYPFVCYSFNIDEKTNQLSLDLFNNAGENYLINSISIANCDSLNPNIVLDAGNRKLFLFVCSFAGEPQFNRNIKINYKVTE